MAVHGIKQLRTSWLDDESDVTDGIGPGTTLRVNESAPVGAKVLERVDTSSVPPESVTVLQLLGQESNQAMLTSDLRQGGATFRKESATAIVEQNQSITSMFTGLVKNIETLFIDKILDKAWKTQAQHFKLMDKEWIRSLIGEDRAAQIEGMSAPKIFAETVNGSKFKSFGISQVLKRQQEFVKIQGLLQTVSGSEILLEEFIRGGLSMGKLLKELLRALDIQEDRLKEDPEPAQGSQEATQAAENIQGGPDMQSQIPQATSAASQGAQDAIPRTEFPGSPAITGGNV